MAVGLNGRVITSADGESWLARDEPAGYGLEDVLWIGDRVVTVGDSGYVASSSDGISWTARSVGTEYFGAASAEDRLIAVGSAGLISTSPSGAEWSHRWTGNPDDLGYDIATSGGTFVIAGQSYILESLNFLIWTRDYRLGATSSCYGVVWTGAQFVAACTSGTMRTSFNGHDWVAHPTDTRASFRDCRGR